MAILREWRAEIRRPLRDEYVEYVRKTGFREYQGTPGNLFALISTRDLDDERSEVVTLSGWVSWEAIEAFAGAEPQVAKYFPEDDRYLLTKPAHVLHYELHAFTGHVHR